jgi:hypothetical protein
VKKQASVADFQARSKKKRDERDERKNKKSLQKNNENG